MVSAFPDSEMADVYDPAAFVGSTHVTPQERERLGGVLAAGLVDAYRHLLASRTRFGHPGTSATPAASIPAYTSGSRSMSNWRHRAMIRCGCTICGARPFATLSAVGHLNTWR